MLFRIDTSSGFNNHNRQYSFFDSVPVILKGGEIEGFIAGEIAKEINGTNDRRLISYSKSLGVCLLKYNNYLDNGLHFAELSSNTHAGYTELCCRIGDEISCVPYYLQCGLDFPFEEAELLNFIADVSDNRIVQNYFQKHLGRGKNPFASPEKDQEVVMMRPLNERVISADNLEFAYVLYGLSMRYDFLTDEDILAGLICDVRNAFNEGRYNYEDTEAIISLIRYMACYGDYERRLSGAVRERNSIGDRIPLCYDLICEYDTIMNSLFSEAYDLTYTSNVITSAIWKWCGIFLGIT